MIWLGPHSGRQIVYADFCLNDTNLYGDDNNLINVTNDMQMQREINVERHQEVLMRKNPNEDGKKPWVDMSPSIHYIATITQSE